MSEKNYEDRTTEEIRAINDIASDVATHFFILITLGANREGDYESAGVLRAFLRYRYFLLTSRCPFLIYLTTNPRIIYITIN